MIKIFTVNKDGKITLTKEELQEIVNEAYWEGYWKNNSTVSISTPSYPYYTWSNVTNDSITLNGSSITAKTATVSNASTTANIDTISSTIAKTANISNDDNNDITSYVSNNIN